VLHLRPADMNDLTPQQTHAAFIYSHPPED
jgi:hypothetical protein